MWRDETYRAAERWLYGADLETLTAHKSGDSLRWIELLEESGTMSQEPPDVETITVEGFVFLLPRALLRDEHSLSVVTKALSEEVRAYKSLLASGVPDADARLVLPDSFTGIEDETKK